MVLPIVLTAAATAGGGALIFGGTAIVVTEYQFDKYRNVILDAYAQGVGKSTGELTSADINLAYDVFRHSLYVVRTYWTDGMIN